MNELLKMPSPSSIRDELEKLVLADLHGPVGGPDEEPDEAGVSERYLVGMLATKHNPAVVDLFDELAVGGKGTDEEGKVDIAPPQAESLIPSSLPIDATSAFLAMPKIRYMHSQLAWHQALLCGRSRVSKVLTDSYMNPACQNRG